MDQWTIYELIGKYQKQIHAIFKIGIVVGFIFIFGLFVGIGHDIGLETQDDFVEAILYAVFITILFFALFIARWFGSDRSTNLHWFGLPLGVAIGGAIIGAFGGFFENLLGWVLGVLFGIPPIIATAKYYLKKPPNNLIKRMEITVCFQKSKIKFW